MSQELQTKLFQAIREANLEYVNQNIAQYVREVGINNKLNNQTAFAYAIQCALSVSYTDLIPIIVNLLLHGANPNLPGSFFFHNGEITPFQYLCLFGDQDLVIFMYHLLDIKQERQEKILAWLKEEKIDSRVYTKIQNTFDIINQQLGNYTKYFNDYEKVVSPCPSYSEKEERLITDYYAPVRLASLKNPTLQRAFTFNFMRNNSNLKAAEDTLHNFKQNKLILKDQSTKENSFYFFVKELYSLYNNIHSALNFHHDNSLARRVIFLIKGLGKFIRDSLNTPMTKSTLGNIPVLTKEDTVKGENDLQRPPEKIERKVHSKLHVTWSDLVEQKKSEDSLKGTVSVFRRSSYTNAETSLLSSHSILRNRNNPSSEPKHPDSKNGQPSQASMCESAYLNN